VSSTKNMKLMIRFVLCLVGIFVSAWIIASNNISPAEAVNFIISPLTISFIVLYVPLFLLFSEMVRKEEGRKCL
jgi:hypothetical protein